MLIKPNKSSEVVLEKTWKELQSYKTKSNTNKENKKRNKLGIILKAIRRIKPPTLVIRGDESHFQPPIKLRLDFFSHKDCNLFLALNIVIA